MDALLPFLPAFAVAIGILFVGASSPGPAVAMLMGLSLSQGRRVALTACLGIATGSATINILTILGVGLVLSQMAWAMTILKILGAAYLTWLAVAAFRKAAHPPPPPTAMVRAMPAHRAFAVGYALQVTNPKAIAFWLAIAALGATQGAPLWIVAVFVAGLWLVSFGCHAAWAVALSAAPVRAAYGRARAWIEGALGAFFLFAAAKLLTARV